MVPASTCSYPMEAERNIGGEMTDEDVIKV